MTLADWIAGWKEFQPAPKHGHPVGGPEIVIVQDGTYSDFNTPSGHVGAQTLEAGTIVRYPKWYGDSLVESGAAIRIEDAAVETVWPMSKIDATDAAVKLAREKEIDLAQVEGSGKDGRIIMADVKKLMQEE